VIGAHNTGGGVLGSDNRIDSGDLRVGAVVAVAMCETSNINDRQASIPQKRKGLLVDQLPLQSVPP
jgi:hypothetical protein